MTSVKFVANAFQVGIENNHVVLAAAVLTPCGRAHQAVDIYLPLSFKDQFTELLEMSEKGEEEFANNFQFQRSHVHNN